MSDNEIAMIVATLNRIDRAVAKLQSDAVTWKTLLAAVSILAVVITVGNQLWGG